MTTRAALRVLTRTLAVAALALVALAAQAQALGPERARTFLTRVGFAPSADEVARFAPLSQAQAVDLVLRESTTAARTSAPAWINDRMLPPRELRQLSDAERMEEQRRRVREGLELRGWWLTEMAATPSPLTERMTLFWHNHFVSAQPKVRYAQLMYRQNVLLRAHALGSFGTLLHAVARDPAMLIYLDGVQNRRGQPNENFAREVMELFTLGPGNYSETDIKEAARAFTGWSLDPDGYVFMQRPFLHDGGEKTVLGRSGRLEGDDVLDQLLAQPATARFVVAKLWREFVAPEPDPARLEAIAQSFRSSRYDIKTALRLLLNQPEVVAPAPAQLLVKSPVELVVGLVRQSGGTLTQPVGAAIVVAQMGQNLFSAPSVRGWPGGEAWINTQTLLVRRQFATRVLAPPGASRMAQPDAAAMPPLAEPLPGPGKRDPMTTKAPRPQPDASDVVRRRLAYAQERAVGVDAAAWLKSAAALSPERPATADDVERLARALGSVPPVELPAPGALSLDALRALLLDPSYQLK
jgi:uncharacterized protein (DUF1800 family)